MIKLFKVILNLDETRKNEFYMLATDEKDLRWELPKFKENDSIQFIQDINEEFITEGAIAKIISELDELAIENYVIPKVVGFHQFDFVKIMSLLLEGMYGSQITRLENELSFNLEDVIETKDFHLLDDLENTITQIGISDNHPLWWDKKIFEMALCFHKADSLTRLSIMNDAIKHLFERYKSEFVEDHKTSFN